MRQLPSPSNLYAAAIVDAWSANDSERLSHGLTQATMLRHESEGDAGECERIELLQAIAGTIQGAGRSGTLNRCAAYILMLRHLAEPFCEEIVPIGHC